MNICGELNCVKKKIPQALWYCVHNNRHTWGCIDLDLWLCSTDLISSLLSPSEHLCQIWRNSWDFVFTGMVLTCCHSDLFSSLLPCFFVSKWNSTNVTTFNFELNCTKMIQVWHNGAHIVIVGRYYRCLQLD